MAMKTSRWVRPLVQRLHAYVPGEQPKVKGLIKLNTNENPYPPSPKVLEKVKRAVDGRLRLYPDPRASGLRQALAEYHEVESNQVIIGNGSDDLLALSTRAFVEPQGLGKDQSARTIQYFDPSYSLYPVLCDIHGARRNPVPLLSDYGIPNVAQLRRGGDWDFKAALTFVTTPNAPSGRGYSLSTLKSLCAAQKGIVILDEAYVDFADEHALSLVHQFPHVLVSRTFSKSFSLCFQRVGYFVGHPDLIAALDRVRDSYNVNGLGQVAALETLKQMGYYRRNLRTICRLREETAKMLIECGFEVLPSQTNFLLVRPPGGKAEAWLTQLRSKKILVRWFSAPSVNQYIRITIGSEKEMAIFERVVRRLSK